jgi:hypothetical protein
MIKYLARAGRVRLNRERLATGTNSGGDEHKAR